MIGYKVLFHPLVHKEDFKKIDNSVQKTIIKAIRRKLTIYPEKYGRPLGRELKGLWKLKVSDWRVIYEIEKEEIRVYVIMVGYRRDEEVYKKVAGRLGLI